MRTNASTVLQAGLTTTETAQRLVLLAHQEDFDQKEPHRRTSIRQMRVRHSRRSKIWKPCGQEHFAMTVRMGQNNLTQAKQTLKTVRVAQPGSRTWIGTRQLHARNVLLASMPANPLLLQLREVDGTVRLDPRVAALSAPVARTSLYTAQ